MTDATPTPYIPAGTNTLLIGPTGTGKTYSLHSALDAGLEVFVISTEPGIASTLGDTDPAKCHWRYIPPASASWSDLLDSAQKINQLSFDALAKMGAINKQKYTQFLEVLTTCNNFVDDRTGQTFGDVATWGPDRMLVVDSLSGLNIMAMNLVVGSKPTKSMADWGVAMDNLKRLIQTLVMNTRCFFTLIGHVEREKDEISGAVKLMVSSLGRKLGPEIPLFFDDVVYAQREGSTFTWSTAALNVDLKARNLPIADKLPPDFGQIVKAWEQKGGRLEV